MKKNSRKTYSKHKPPSKNYWVVIASISLAIVSVTVAGFYFYKHPNNFITYRIDKLVANAKSVVHAKTPVKSLRPKSIAQKKINEEDQIHYEFYTSLPSIQVTPPEPPDTAQKSVANAQELEEDLSKNLIQTKKRSIKREVT